MSVGKFREYPYLESLTGLQHAYPPLRSFLPQVQNRGDEGRRLVQDTFLKRFGRLPGRCTLLTFTERAVQSLDFLTPEHLDEYLDEFPTLNSTGNVASHCRLWILEDLEPAWIDVLGRRLGVDPLVFSEQMNTWNFTNSESIAARIPPSMVQPSKSFTIRYYEFRQLTNPDSISALSNQTTFAANRRRYERWRDVDTESFRNRYRHGFIRRCASFWTNQTDGKDGWDAVMLVDPAFDSVAEHDSTKPQTNELTKSSSPHSGVPGCLILQDGHNYNTVKDLWKARDSKTPDSLTPTLDTSKPYHHGSTTLAEASISLGEGRTNSQSLSEYSDRNLTSPLDEIVFHWTKLASPDLASSARTQSINAAHYLLKYIATSWMNQLELIACGVAQSEYFADDHEATVSFDTAPNVWKSELQTVTSTTRDMNYMKRQLYNFDRALTLNIERLGLIPGFEAIDPSAPQAIRDAQADFLSIQARLRPFLDRVAGLSGMANELANLHMAFKSIKDSEFGLRLSLLGSVIFPATLVTSLLSMGDGYRPGQHHFWVFWAAAVPLVALFTLVLVVGRRPERWFEERMKDLQAKREREAQGLRRETKMA